MKKLIILSIFALVGWTSFYDLTKGTLSFLSTEKVSQAASQPASIEKPKLPFKMIKIQPGDTVLSVHERINPEATVTIKKVLSDFRTLNPDAEPNHIKIGSSYRFPTYPSEAN